LDSAGEGSQPGNNWTYDNKNPFPVVVQVNDEWAASAEALSSTPEFTANADDTIGIHEHNGKLALPGHPSPRKARSRWESREPGPSAVSVLRTPALLGRK
jgi:hypothetical protein